MKIHARVGMSFEVDEELFKENPSEAIGIALAAGRAEINGWDSYAPGPWNTGATDDDVTFILPRLKVAVSN